MKNTSNINIRFSILIGLLLMIMGNTMAQRNIFKEYETTTINISNDSLYLRFSIYNENPKVSVKKHLAYTWFKSNKMFVTKGGYDGKLLHGEFTSFFVSDQMMEKGNYKKGVKDGEWMLWEKDGSINMVVNWKDGKLNGTTTIYKGDKVRTEINYEDGKLVIDEKSNKKSADWEEPEEKPAEIGEKKDNFFKLWMMKRKTKKRSKKVKNVK